MTDPVSPRRAFGIRLGPVSISLTLALSMALLVAVALIAVLAIQWSANRTNTLTLLNEKAEILVDELAARVGGHLLPAESQVAFLAERITRGEVAIGDRDRLGTLLTGALAAAPQVGALIVVNDRLERLLVRRTGDGGTAVEFSDRSGDPLVREGAAQSRLLDRPFWGGIVLREGVPVLNLRAPLLRDGLWIGFLVAEVSVPEMSEFVAQLGERFGTTAFILYGKDRVLAHPNLTSRHPDQSEAEPVVRRDRVGDPVLAELWNGRPYTFFEAASERGAGVLGVDVAGYRYVAIYRTVQDFGVVPLTLGCWFPEADLDQPFQRLRMAAAAGLAAVLLAVVAAVLLGRFIARPIRRVAEGAARVGAFELAEVERLPRSLITELDDLARAFNAMLAGLRSFETYVPRALVTRLIRRTDAEPTASAEVELTVMFTDIVGFTAMSENLPAAEVATFLNDHFALLAACIEAEGGTIDKFIGDGLMAFWGAPDPQTDTARRACRAAAAIPRPLAAANARRRACGLPPVRVRIGIHTGPAVVGNIGAPGRINYTIVGDTVNTAARLEDLGHDVIGPEAELVVLLSEATADRLGPAFALEQAGAFRLRGRDEAVVVHRLAGYDPERDDAERESAATEGRTVT